MALEKRSRARSLQKWGRDGNIAVAGGGGHFCHMGVRSGPGDMVFVENSRAEPLELLRVVAANAEALPVR